GASGNANDLSLTGIISGTNFQVTKVGGGTLTFGGGAANTYTGQTTVDEGTLVLAKTAGNAIVPGVLVVGDFSGTDSVVVTTNVAQMGSTPTIVNSSGVLDISNSTTAQTIGTLEVRGGGLVKTTGTNNNTLNVGATVTGIATSTTGATVATATIPGNLNLTAATTVNVADSGTTPGLAIPALISGAQALTKGGAGTLVLNGTVSNTYTGVTTVNAGTLLLRNTGGLAIPGNVAIGDGLGGTGAAKGDVVRLLANNQIGVSAAVTIQNSGLLDLNGFSNTIGVAQTNALSMVGGSAATGAGTLTLGGNIADLVNLSSQTPATISGNLSLGGATRTIDVQPGTLATQNPNAVGLNPNDLVISAII